MCLDDVAPALTSSVSRVKYALKESKLRRCNAPPQARSSGQAGVEGQKQPTEKMHNCVAGKVVSICSATSSSR